MLLLRFENQKAYRIIENLLEKTLDAEETIKRLSLQAIEGKLEEQSHGKFRLITNNGNSIGYELSCGSYLEVFSFGEWYVGRVEHKTTNGKKGYYFCNNDLEHPFLYTGMVARVRR